MHMRCWKSLLVLFCVLSVQVWESNALLLNHPLLQILNPIQILHKLVNNGNIDANKNINSNANTNNAENINTNINLNLFNTRKSQITYAHVQSHRIVMNDIQNLLKNLYQLEVYYVNDKTHYDNNYQVRGKFTIISIIRFWIKQLESIEQIEWQSHIPSKQQSQIFKTVMQNTNAFRNPTNKAPNNEQTQKIGIETSNQPEVLVPNYTKSKDHGLLFPQNSIQVSKQNLTDWESSINSAKIAQNQPPVSISSDIQPPPHPEKLAVLNNKQQNANTKPVLPDSWYYPLPAFQPTPLPEITQQHTLPNANLPPALNENWYYTQPSFQNQWNQPRRFVKQSTLPKPTLNENWYDPQLLFQSPWYQPNVKYQSTLSSANLKPSLNNNWYFTPQESIQNPLYKAASVSDGKEQSMSLIPSLKPTLTDQWNYPQQQLVEKPSYQTTPNPELTQLMNLDDYSKLMLYKTYQDKQKSVENPSYQPKSFINEKPIVRRHHSKPILNENWYDTHPSFPLQPLVQKYIENLSTETSTPAQKLDSPTSKTENPPITEVQNTTAQGESNIIINNSGDHTVGGGIAISSSLNQIQKDDSINMEGGRTARRAEIQENKPSINGGMQGTDQPATTDAELDQLLKGNRNRFLCDLTPVVTQQTSPVRKRIVKHVVICEKEIANGPGAKAIDTFST